MRVVTIAIIMPTIPKMFPNLEDSGWDNPLSANINNNAEIKYNIDTKEADIFYFFFFGFFLNIESIR